MTTVAEIKEVVNREQMALSLRTELRPGRFVMGMDRANADHTEDACQ
jgi:hypothetical protein